MRRRAFTEMTVAAPRIAVRLQGLPPNTRGIGARIKVTGGPAWLQSQEMICGDATLLAMIRCVCSLPGHRQNLLKIEVDWRAAITVRSSPPDHVYEVEEAKPSKPKSPVRNRSPQSHIPDSNPQPSTLNSQPLSGMSSHLIGHVHSDEPFSMTLCGNLSCPTN